MFGSDISLCRAAQFFHCYFAMMNIIVILFLVEAHRSSLLEDPFKSRTWIHKYGAYVYILFPCIQIIPYAMDDHQWMDMGDDSVGWCSLPVKSPLGLSIGVFFLWVWICIFTATFLMVYSAVRILRTDRVIGSKFLSNVGILVVIAIASWIPRSLERSHHTGRKQTSLQYHALSLIPINICGILFGLIFFFFEKPSVAVLKDIQSGFQAEQESIFRSSFTWETDDLDFLNDELNNTAIRKSSPNEISMGTMSVSKYMGDGTTNTLHREFSVDNPINMSEASLKNASRSTAGFSDSFA